MPDQKLTRWQQHEAATGSPPQLPPLEAGDYLASAFTEIGMVQATPFGLSVLSWTEINAYAQATGAIQSRWECAMIRTMSAAYLDGQTIGTDAFGIPPWSS